MNSHALYLHTLASLEDLSYDPSNTMVFALPRDVVKGEIVGADCSCKSVKTGKVEQKEANN